MSKDKNRYTKRASKEADQPRKRRKKNSPDHESSISRQPEVMHNGLTTKLQESKRAPSMSPAPDSGKEIVPLPQTHIQPEVPGAEQSESEMSVLLDREPRKRGRPGKPKITTKKSASAKSQKSTDVSNDPEIEEIKRLQNWRKFVQKPVPHVLSFVDPGR